MYSKLAMTCFKYQVYLYGSEAITYLKEKTCMVEELSHVKQLSLIHACKLGLKG
jgi:hypothetical protein